MNRKTAIHLFGSEAVNTAENLFNEDGFEHLFTSKEQPKKEDSQWDYIKIAQNVIKSKLSPV